MLSYEDTARHIKVEINRRQFGSRYEIKTYLGVSMLVMVPEDVFAHKLVAMHERIGKTSRDIYDVWFFLQQWFPINREIVEKRSGMFFDTFLQTCIVQLEKMSNRHILDGVGEFLTSSQKDWAKAKLREETIFFIEIEVGELATGWLLGKQFSSRPNSMISRTGCSGIDTIFGKNFRLSKFGRKKEVGRSNCPPLLLSEIIANLVEMKV